ncbi:MAG: T9SS type A sorting domain-containing protein [Candidatus Cloacimonetes bacterium]|nr:T9SS type A sorting domain-containing protein [Candidatus Cloacimonadota bacterium]
MKRVFFLLTMVAFISLSASVTKTVSEPDRLTCHISFPASLIENQSFSEINIDLDSWTVQDTPGAPALPYTTLRIAVPPAGKLRITTNISKSKTLTLDYPLLPAPTIIPGEKSSEFLSVINENLYTDPQPEIVMQGEPYYHRGFTLIPLTIYPCNYDHQNQTITFREEFDINIEILGNTNWRESYPAEKAWLDKDFIANYQQARYWRQTRSLPKYGIEWEKSQFWYRLDISGSGTYCLTPEDLSILPDFADYSTLRLFALAPFDDEGESRFQRQELPLAFSDKNICFQYQGTGTALWLALAGNFTAKPLRTTITNTSFDPLVGISEKQPLLRNNRNLECILIRPEGYFESQAEELMEIHQQYFNVETAVVIQEEIFQIYSGGIPMPQSINTYLDTLRLANPSLEYVVLLGSGTSDFGNSTEKNKIITYNKLNVTSDDYFVDFNNDNRPDLVIGRIPAQSESMMAKYLQRIRDYYEEMESGWWQNKVLFIADDENKSGGLEGTSPTSGMNHTLRLEDTMVALEGRLIEKVYGLEYPFDAYQSKPEATSDIIEYINDGVLISYYIGHGAWDNLGDEDYFSLGDIQLLQNYQHLTHFIAASCNVGEFDQVGNDCMAEVIIFADDGGAISSIAASESSGPTANYQLMKAYLNALSNLGYSTGKALQYAKNNSPAAISNSNKYNILGDPLIFLPLPYIIGNISGLPDSLQHRDTVSYTGDFGDTRLNSTGETLVLDSPQLIHYYNFIPPDTTNFYEVDYLGKANTVFRGEVDIAAGLYSTTLIVPDDAIAGEKGEIITLSNNEDGRWLNTLKDIKYAESSLNIANDDAPQITIYLDSRNFRSGDTVSGAPLIIAEISDANGINVSGSPGKSILVLIDDSENPDDLIDVTSGFLYDSDSYTQGTLNWQLEQLTNGYHNIKLIVYDNFGSPSVASTEFSVAAINSISISDLLAYPNPMSTSGYFTFVLTESAQVSISIYTISGKKLQTLHYSADTGYNQVAWDCHDADGDRLANNNYFYKVKARGNISDKSAEALGKLIILN